MDVDQIVQAIALYALPVLFAITLHEAAHGYMARRFGDMTAHAQGRISLNPARHIDPIGTLLVPLVILVASGGRFFFGWAKPIPVNYSALRRPRQHMAWVAAAGPAANLGMALGWAILMKLALLLPSGYFTEPLAAMSRAGVVVNLVFMFLNLVPILPLDGGRILASLLPTRIASPYARLEPWGLPILLLLIVTHVLDALLDPLIDTFTSLLLSFVAA